MKKIFNVIILMLLAFISVTYISCSKEFVTLDPKGQFLSESYYANRDQAYGALIGVYDLLRKNAGGFENMITMMNAGSDDNYAGGGNSSDGAGIHGFSNYTINTNTIPGSYWSDYYQGIARANALILRLPNVPMDETEKARFMAEAKTLRAIYYFNLVRLFKNIPLLLEPLTTSTMYNVTQADPADVYAQIEKDISESVNDLPGTLPDAELGRITKGAAQAMLGKVYLYDNKKTEAAAMLAEVNGTPGAANQYGNKLLTSFAALWDFKNKFNTEGILCAMHTDQSNADWGWWGTGADEGNSVNIMVGPRSYSRKTGSTAPDIVSGWTFNVWTSDFVKFMGNDPRAASTILDLNSYVTSGEVTYVKGDQDSGYFLRKFIPLTSDVRTGGGAMELNFQQNDYIIRLADTYLLEAEALGATGARAQALLDAVRARVGLASVPVSLQAVKDERRRELAGEGHRFFDLVRWGEAATVLSKKANSSFVAGKSEILPIPARELQGTKLVQNPGYN